MKTIKILRKTAKIEGRDVSMELKMLPVSVKAVEDAPEGEGIIEAYVSVFGNVDSYGDIMQKGAFAASLAKWMPRFPKGIWAHDWSKPIAKTLEAREDEHGLYIRGKLALGVQQAREAWELIKEGIQTDFSFGFTIDDSEYDNAGHRLVKAVTMYEWSPVLVGANDQATLLSFKSADADYELEEREVPDDVPAAEEEKDLGDDEPAADEGTETIAEELAEQDMYEQKWANMESVYDIVSAFYRVYFDENTPVENFADLVKEMIGLLQQIADGTAAPEYGETAIAAGKSDDMRTVFAKALASRLETDVKEMEAKAGRMLSAKNTALIKSVKEALSNLHGDMGTTVDALDTLLKEAEGAEEEGSKGNSSVDETISRDEARLVLKTVRRSVDAGGKLIVRLKKVAGEA